MPSSAFVKATSPSFSAHPVLRAEFEGAFPAGVVNAQGIRMDEDALIAFLAEAEGAVIGLEPVTERVLDACPRLRGIAKYGVGLDNVDLEACAERGIRVGWTPGSNKRSVTELVLAYMLSLSRNVFASSAQLKGGVWNKQGGVQLSGRTVGIVGLGNVGQDLAPILRALGCTVLGNDIEDRSVWCAEQGVEAVDFDTLIARSDAVTLHVPLTELTRRMVNADVLKRMRPSAILVNTSRGEVVDQAALKRALMAGEIAGAGLDVYETEPPGDQEFLGLSNLICTPHIGGSAEEAILAMGRNAIGHLRAYFAAD